ncbi:MAG TPA: ERAP1-like C-terminal domain-containing protein, partial [Thermoanaerobaculia bacterium]|nr:ERAP1-like C-terminal domain-containing protein [Thermoanaerobaculia bacterium]
PLDAVLPLLAAVADSPSHHLVAAVVEILAKLDPHLVPAGRRAAYEAFVRQLFGERARALGLLPRPGESDEERFLRKEVVVLVADHGGDERLRAEGRRLAERWLEDREAVPPEAADLALVAAALSGDAALYDRYLAALRAEPDRRHRTRLLSGLFSFREPALVRRSWGLLLDPEIDPREVVRALRDSARGPDSPPAGLELLEGHVERLAARLPEQWAMDLPRLIGELCGREHLPRLEALRPRLAPIRGAGDELDAALEQLRLCLARRAAQLPAAECFFGLVTTLGISSTRTSSRGRAISRRRSSGPARSTTPAPPTRSVPANSRSMAASSGSAPSGGGRLARPADSDFEADRAVL